MSIEHGVGSSYRREDGGRDWRVHRNDHDRSGPPGTAELDDLSFWDVLDIFNPLQHIPLLSIAYREITGDTLHPTARVLGGGLYGGPAGLLIGAINAAFEQETGRDVGGTVLAAFRGEELVPDPTDAQLATRPTSAAEAAISAAEIKEPEATAVQTDALRPSAGMPTPDLPSLALAPIPSFAPATTTAAGGSRTAAQQTPIRVSTGLDAALRALAASTGGSDTSPAKAAAAYRGF